MQTVIFVIILGILMLYAVLFLVNISILRGFWKLMDDCAEELGFNEMYLVFYGSRVYVCAADFSGKLKENAMYDASIYPSYIPLQTCMHLKNCKKRKSMLDKAVIRYDYTTGKLTLIANKKTYVFLKSPAFSDLLFSKTT
jgi:hypothetical protein